MRPLSFSERVKAFFTRDRSRLNELLEELEDSLVEGDIGPQLALSISSELRKICHDEGLRDIEDLKRHLAIILRKKLTIAETELSPDRLNIVLLLGVNGVGKTTSAAKLAFWYRSRFGLEPVMAAADTFRAAAIEQLKIHGERLGVRVVAHKTGGDPAAVLFDAIETAKARSIPLIIADSAGRMHTKSGLVEELKKIDRIVSSKAQGAVYRKLLVIDATTGRNALSQAEIFKEAVGLDGVVLTKLDSSAKGGIAFSLAADLSLAPAFVCDGEAYENIAPFDPDDYICQFLG